MFTLFACAKKTPLPESNDPVMPPLTHQGLNTFGCYIDGELYVANKGESYWDLPPVSGSFNEITKEFNIQSARYLEAEENDEVIILADITDGLGTYNFRYNSEGGTPGYRNWYGDKCDYYYLDYPGFEVGELTITYLNQNQNIISGTFYINLVNDNCEGDTLMKITDGRFDFHY